MTDIAPTTEITEDDLCAVATDILMAVLGPETMCEPTVELERDFLAAALDIVGADNPRFVIGAEVALARQVAVEFFGAEDAEEPAAWSEALCELCNVTAGSLKPLLAPATAVLGLPAKSSWPATGGVRGFVESEFGGFGLILLPQGTSLS